MDRRPFQAVSVGTCYAQTANDRFGDGASQAVRERERSAGLDGQGPFDWPGSDPEDDQDFPEESVYRLVPTMQRYRNNLTALSQLYNLYFVAYQGQIFVYVPRSVPRQTIPRHPDLRLVPEPSEVSQYIGGYQDPVTPHTINHMIVGSLGRQEIVVACYDDGDVVAYYTSEVADGISGRPNPSSTIPPVQKRASHGTRDSSPRPFFHENVGKSAWGLAVHKTSRLIAVSSNRCEVTVFAFALATGKEEKQEADTCPGCSGTGCVDIEQHVRQRARNWRIVVTLGLLADNMPNICFVDDNDGSACLICAVDIKGAVWLADIWTPAQGAMRIEPSNSMQLRNSEAWPTPSRGWGILALPDTNFLKVKCVEELLGLSIRHLGLASKNTLDVGRCIYGIPNNPGLQETNDGLPDYAVDLADDLHDDELEPGAVPNVDFQILLGTGEGSGDSDGSGGEEDDGEGADDDEDDTGDGDGSDMELDDGDEDSDDGSEVAAVAESSIGSGETTQPIPNHVLVQAQPPTTVLSGNGSLALMDAVLALEQANNEAPPWVLQAMKQALSAGSSGATATRPEEGGRPRGPSSARLDMAYFPHKGHVCLVPRETGKLVSFLRRRAEHDEKLVGHLSRMERFAQRYHVLRLHEKEVELRSLEPEDKRELGVLCPQVMNMGRELSPATKLLFRATSRLSMVVHLPEMSLVVVGSPIGRVLLVTPTQLERTEPRGHGILHHGFRVDWVLPRRSDERLYRRTPRPLHGMAVAPVQEKGVSGGRDDASRMSAPRRYRLMLHYRNHDILTFEITREEETGKLCIL
ncbi:Uncharacterized protein TPAR_08560 [Tolypocladium paradoxum]|uniref:Pyridine nucleotide-disulfide oxidoreductase family protein n=1 Tax=Tolypocladium paradoxum TaxID=94208 RepID=A0A2S4KLY2_9HYPO|nr:Uncharacterized protein TPAR_08560 [Tolypocladium paradoxum]